MIGGEEVAHRRHGRGRSCRTTRARPRRRPPGRRRPRSSRRSTPPARPGRTGRATPWEERAAVFLRAAELLAGPWRDTLNAATMLGQSKTAHQAEIDAACELIDFWRFNVEFMRRIYEEQPISSPGSLEPDGVPAARGLRLRGHAVQLHRDRRATCRRAPALMGNTVVWKPASTAVYSAHFLMQLFAGGGPPAGRDQPRATARRARSATPRSRAPTSPASTSPARPRVFQAMWRTVGSNIARYRNYPRIVGETGGKDFIVAHPSADVDAVATAIVRGSFEYQGQKCSAASRVYVAAAACGRSCASGSSSEVGSIKMGDVSDFSNFMGAVIDAQRVHDAEGGDRGGTRRPGPRCARRRRRATTRGLVRRADGDRDRATRTSGCCATSCSARS